MVNELDYTYIFLLRRFIPYTVTAHDLRVLGYLSS